MNLWLRLIMAGIMSLFFSAVGLMLGALVHYLLAGSTVFGPSHFGNAYASPAYSLISGYAANGWQAGLIGGALIGFLVTKDVKLRITTDGQ